MAYEIPKYHSRILDYTIEILRKKGYYIECSSYNPISGISTVTHFNEENMDRCFPVVSDEPNDTEIIFLP